MYHQHASIRLALPALSQPPHRLPLDSQPHPLIHPLRTQALVKAERTLVPLQTAPLQTATIDAQQLGRQRAQQQLSVSALAVRRPHKQIFEVDSRGGAPRAVVVEEERHAGDLWRAGRVVVAGRRKNEEGLGKAGGCGCAGGGGGGGRVRGRKGESGEQGLLGRLDRVERVFVDCELFNHAKDFGDVCRRESLRH